MIFYRGIEDVYGENLELPEIEKSELSLAQNYLRETFSVTLHPTPLAVFSCEGVCYMLFDLTFLKAPLSERSGIASAPWKEKHCFPTVPENVFSLCESQIQKRREIHQMMKSMEEGEKNGNKSLA